MRIKQSYQAMLSIFLTVLCMPSALLRPYETTVVPAWRLQVVDQYNAPVGDIIVNYSWKHYSLETDGHEEQARTDKDGYVSFPEHKVEASLLARIVGPNVNIMQSGIHASFGPSGHMVVWGKPDKFEIEGVEYNGWLAPPSRVILRRVKDDGGMKTAS